MHCRLPILVIANCQLPISSGSRQLPMLRAFSDQPLMTIQSAIGNWQLAITRIGNWQSEMLLVLPTVQQEGLRQNSVAAIIQARLTNR
jgi:hypothetical protein